MASIPLYLFPIILAVFTSHISACEQVKKNSKQCQRNSIEASVIDSKANFWILQNIQQILQNQLAQDQASGSGGHELQVLLCILVVVKIYKLVLLFRRG
ncbi:unnamed protein product [Allacma fusca]|uniref:Uncharacterized protein n=1 Tax=Allacma fusca TaxID=39272 RepID=A0A8J2K279_9HEXA|nr:unnamed protein product [Allacma fusca]